VCYPFWWAFYYASKKENVRRDFSTSRSSFTESNKLSTAACAITSLFIIRGGKHEVHVSQEESTNFTKAQQIKNMVAKCLFMLFTVV
jgi:hypothetical protein